MQRIALGTFAVSLVFAAVSLWGCQTRAPGNSLGPPPGPLLSTHAPRRVEPIPWRATPPRAPRYEPAPTPLALPVRPADIRVAKGIKRDKWQLIVVHHSAADNATPQGMDRYHRVDKRWSGGLGYHFVIGNGVNYPDGQLYVGPRWKSQRTGAHCASSAGRYVGRWCPDNHFNEHGIGICLIGNFEHSRPTPAQLKTLTELIAVLVDEVDINPSYVWGHGEVTHRTACPGRHLSMSHLRRAVAHRVDERRSIHASSGLTSAR